MQDVLTQVAIETSTMIVTKGNFSYKQELKNTKFKTQKLYFI